MKKYIAEMIGTFTLVLLGTGVAVVSGGNIMATSLAFGLAIVSMAYVIGPVSGCHVNPAVSLAKLINKELNIKDFCFYCVFQIIGALLGTGALYMILKNTTIGTVSLGANGYRILSATNISLSGAIMTEVILTFIFVYTILGVTGKKEYSNISGIVIGLTLAFVHLLGINLTGTSVNPARSLAPAIFLKGRALKQVWVFIISPLIGSAIAALVYDNINKKKFKFIKTAEE